MGDAEDVCWISYTLEGIDYHPDESGAKKHVKAWTRRHLAIFGRPPDESGWIGCVTAELADMRWTDVAPVLPAQAQEIERLRARVAELEAEADGVARGVARRSEP
jgi:hypothetical protein